MSIEHNVTFTSTDAGSIMDIDAWVSTLSMDEQSEFAAADVRQKAYRQVFIDSGVLTIGH